MATIQGLKRLRKHQIGKQSVLGTVVAATRVLPYDGAITINPNRTFVAADVGTLDESIAPYDMARDVTATLTGQAFYNDLPYRLSAGLMGGVTGSTAAGVTTWTYQAASLTADTFDYFSDEWGDDTADSPFSPTDGILAFGGVIDTFEEQMPQDLGPWTINDQWFYAGATFGARTGSLSVDAAPTPVFGADTVIYMDTVPGSIGITPVSDAVRQATFRVSNNLDRKRFANGSNTRFQLAGYGRGQRQVDLILTVDKTSQMAAERHTILNDPTAVRYFRVSTVSTTIISGSATYAYDRYVPAYLVSASDADTGGNTTIQLTYRGAYDATLGYAIKAVVKNGLASL